MTSSETKKLAHSEVVCLWYCFEKSRRTGCLLAAGGLGGSVSIGAKPILRISRFASRSARFGWRNSRYSSDSGNRNNAIGMSAPVRTPPYKKKAGHPVRSMLCCARRPPRTAPIGYPSSDTETSENTSRD